MLTIRKATHKDCPGIAEIHTRAVRAIPGNFYPPDAIAQWSIPRALENYQQAIDEKEFYVAERDGVLIGFAVLVSQNPEIEAVYVSPEAKGEGVGAKLLSKLEERARDLGLKVLRLNASLNAVAFYQRAGFRALEESTYRLATGFEIRCVPMIKELG